MKVHGFEIKGRVLDETIRALRVRGEFSLWTIEMMLVQAGVPPRRGGFAVSLRAAERLVQQLKAEGEIAFVADDDVWRFCGGKP